MSQFLKQGFACILSLALTGGASSCGKESSNESRIQYSLEPVTNIELSPIYQHHGVGQTIGRAIVISDTNSLNRITYELDHPSDWQGLVPSSWGHWLSDRKLKLILRCSDGRVLGIWVEFYTNLSRPVARFDVLADPQSQWVPRGDMADTGSQELAETLLGIIRQNNTTWVDLVRD